MRFSGLGSGLGSSARWQWQPSTRFHDPGPPITLESNQVFPTTGVLYAGEGADQSPAAIFIDGPDGGTYGNLQRLSNVIRPITTDAWSYISEDYGPDSEVWVDGLTIPTSGSIDVNLRLQSVGGAGLDGYDITMRVDGYLRFYRIDNSAYVQIGSGISTSWVSGNGFGVSIRGSELFAYQEVGGEWVELGSRMDSTYSAAGKIAIFLEQSDMTAANIGGGHFSSAKVRSPIFTRNAPRVVEARTRPLHRERPVLVRPPRADAPAPPPDSPRRSVITAGTAGIRSRLVRSVQMHRERPRISRAPVFGTRRATPVRSTADKSRLSRAVSRPSARVLRSPGVASWSGSPPATRSLQRQRPTRVPRHRHAIVLRPPAAAPIVAPSYVRPKVFVSRNASAWRSRGAGSSVRIGRTSFLGAPAEVHAPRHNLTRVRIRYFGKRRITA